MILALALVIPVCWLVPFLGGRFVPVYARIPLCVVLAAAVASPTGGLNGGALAAALIAHVAVGACIGFAVRLVFEAAASAGRAIVGLAGYDLVASGGAPHDPGERSPLGVLYSLMLAAVFLAINRHHLLITALHTTAALLPRVTDLLSVDGALFVGLVSIGARFFEVVLLVTLPAIAALLITDIAFSLATRAAPAARRGLEALTPRLTVALLAVTL